MGATNPKLREQKEFTEIFRHALMKEHSDDWTMEVISEAAYICATTVQESFRRTKRCSTCGKMFSTNNFRLIHERKYHG